MTCIFGFGLVRLEETPQVEKNANHVDDDLHGLGERGRRLATEASFISLKKRIPEMLPIRMKLP